MNRLRLQFSLRSIFVLLTVTAVAVAWLGNEFHAYRGEQSTIAQLNNAYVVNDESLIFF